MSTKAYYVDCPWCMVPTVVYFSEYFPTTNNQCMAVCDYCKGSFGLLSSDYCKTCSERPNCFQYPAIDLLNLLIDEKILRIDYKTGLRYITNG